MKNKILGVIIAMCLVLTAGCSKSTDSNKNDNQKEKVELDNKEKKVSKIKKNVGKKEKIKASYNLDETKLKPISFFDDAMNDTRLYYIYDTDDGITKETPIKNILKINKGKITNYWIDLTVNEFKKEKNSLTFEDINNLNDTEIIELATKYNKLLLDELVHSGIETLEKSISLEKDYINNTETDLSVDKEDYVGEHRKSMEFQQKQLNLLLNEYKYSTPKEKELDISTNHINKKNNKIQNISTYLSLEESEIPYITQTENGEVLTYFSGVGSDHVVRESKYDLFFGDKENNKYLQGKIGNTKYTLGKLGYGDKKIAIRGGRKIFTNKLFEKGMKLSEDGENRPTIEDGIIIRK